MVLTRQAAAVVSVGTYWPWEPTTTLRSALCRRGWLGGARRFGAHRGRRRARAVSVPYIILVFLGVAVLDLGPMYTTDRQTSDSIIA